MKLLKPRAVRIYEGVIKYLTSKIDGLDSTNTKARDIQVNNLLIKFGNDNDIRMEANSALTYKGMNNPCITNCKTVQKHWGLFMEWLHNNYEF